MSPREAWIVTGLGMVVVFFGLVLCIAFIQLFNRIARRITRGEAGHLRPAAPDPPATEPAPEAPAELPVGEPVPPEVLAVIAAVLEIENRLYLPRPGSRLTIRRPAPQH